jgi:hypothetical protein
MPVSRRYLRFIVPSVAAPLLAGVLFLPALGSAQSGGQIDLRGTWNAGACVGGTLAQCEANPQYPQKFAIETENLSTGAIAGTGPGYTLTGTVSGSTLTMHTTQPGYTSDWTATINAAATKLQGTFNDSYGRMAQPAFANRASGPPTETTTTTTTSTSSSAGLRPTATSVICNYEVASSTDTCGATVGDAGPAPSVAPTGTVKFTGSAPGSFASGATCALSASPFAPSAPSCTIQFYTSDGTVLPSITATYSGDSQHASSSGATHYFGGDPSGETTTEAPTPPPGEYGDEVEVSTNVPVADSTVQACAAPGSASGSAAGLFDSLGSMLGGLGPKIGKIADPTVAAQLKAGLGDLNKLDGVEGMLQGLNASQLNTKLTGPFSVEANNAVGQVLSALHLAEGDAQHDSAGAADQQKAQQALQQMQQITEKLSELLRLQEAATCGAINNIRSVVPRAAIAARHKTAARGKRGGKLLHLAYSLQRHVHAGPLTIKLHLNRAQLKRLAGKRHSLTLIVRVNMLLPSKAPHGGVPMSVVKTITLKQGPGKAKHSKPSPGKRRHTGKGKHKHKRK